MSFNYRVLSVGLVLLVCVAYASPQGGFQLTDLVKGSLKDELLGVQVQDMPGTNTTKSNVPNGVILMKKNVKELRNGRRQVRYEFGNRRYGDGLVAHSEDYLSYYEPRDVRLVLRYPANGGLGARVSYGLIQVEADNALGDAYIIDGGVGYRFIVIEVLAYTTQTFGFDAKIFGY